MPQNNEPHNYPSRRPSSRSYNQAHTQHSHRVPTSQRVNIPNARDELEREREMYSAHDPRQSALSPAQRYARAQNNKTDTRQCYWTQHPGIFRAGFSQSVSGSWQLIPRISVRIQTKSRSHEPHPSRRRSHPKRSHTTTTISFKR